MSEYKDSLLRGTIQLGDRTFDVDMGRDTTINQDDLTNELCAQPGLVCYYGELRAIALRARDTAEMMLKGAKAVVQQTVRTKAASETRKMNNDEVEAAVLLDPAIIVLNNEYIEACYTYERFHSAWGAMRERGVSLNSIAAIKREEMRVNDRVLEEDSRRLRSR